MFCALSILIGQLKSEGVVDVFQTVKQLRVERPAMVQTKVCYFFVRYSRQLKNRHRRGQLAFISRLEFNFALYLHGCKSGQSITYVIGYKFCFETIESTI